MHFCGERGAAERKGERRSRSSNASCALYNACYVIVFPQFSPPIPFPTLSGVFTHLLAIIKASCRDVLATLQRISARCGKNATQNFGPPAALKQRQQQQQQLQLEIAATVRRAAATMAKE